MKHVQFARRVFAMIFSVSVFSLYPLGSAYAIEGLQVDAVHGQLKTRLQVPYYSATDMESIVAELKKLIAQYEAATGKNSIQVGLLLLDIGEASIKRSLPPFGVFQAQHLRRGIEAIQVGERILARQQSAIMNRARAHFYLGRALLLLGEKADAERALRTGLAIHWRVYNDDAWQLKFFEYLFDAVKTGKAKREVAEGELKIARGLSGNHSVEIQNAEHRVQQAQLTANPLVAELDAVRVKAGAEAKAGKGEEAYRTLANMFAKLSTENDRELFIARMKPDAFLMYDDPLTRDKRTQGDDNDVGVSPYDLIAARFLVDRGLKPFIAESRGNLLKLLDFLEVAFRTADRTSSQYFCRLIPPNYGGYDDHLPNFCNGTTEWAAWEKSQGNAGTAVRLLELGIALLPKTADRTSDERHFFQESQKELAELEAEHGSPDSFFSAYELIDGRAKPELSFIDFYAGIISDSPTEVIAALPATEKAHLESDSGRKIDPLGKLALVGNATARALCIADLPTLNGITQAQMCIAAGLENEISVEALSATVKRIVTAPDWDPKGPRVQFDWTAYRLFSEMRFSFVREALSRYISPGQLDEKYRFVKGSLNETEKHFLMSPIGYEAYIDARIKNPALPDPQYSETFRMAQIADALAESGKIDLARAWAVPALQEHQSAGELARFV